MKLPRLLIAAPGSGSGKTTLSLLLAVWARSQGLDTRAFKAGPDFIDSQYLAQAAGRPVPSLDPWFLPPARLRRHFQAWAQGGDFALVEGVMGLYDGKRGVPFGRYSSAEVARTLDLPVVLVLNARKAGPTLATQALGLVKADPRLRFAGVVLNQAMGQKTVEPLARAIKHLTGLPTLGWLPALDALRQPERHLGLVAASERQGWLTQLQAALPQAEKTLDFSGLLRVARSARTWSSAAPLVASAPSVPTTAGLRLPGGASPRGRSGVRPFRLAVAKDEAFHFYYPENLKLWQDLGADLVFFSPLRDARLPQGTQGLLIGGGFPESFGPELAANGPLKRELRRAIAGGLPVWAECGGLMWLCERLVDGQGKAHAMVGALKATVRMGAKLQNFGYTEALASKTSAWPGGAFRLKGHEFHHSLIEAREGLSTGWSLRQSARPDRAEGFRVGPRGLATYFHAYLPSDPRAAQAFAKACRLK